MLDTNFETCENVVLQNSFRVYKSKNLGRPLQKKNCNYFSLCEESALTSNDFLSNQKVKKKKKNSKAIYFCSKLQWVSDSRTLCS